MMMKHYWSYLFLVAVIVVLGWGFYGVGQKRLEAEERVIALEHRLEASERGAVALRAELEKVKEQHNRARFFIRQLGLDKEYASKEKEDMWDWIASSNNLHWRESIVSDSKNMDASKCDRARFEIRSGYKELDAVVNKHKKPGVGKEFRERLLTKEELETKSKAWGLPPEALMSEYCSKSTDSSEKHKLEKAELFIRLSGLYAQYEASSLKELRDMPSALLVIGSRSDRQTSFEGPPVDVRVDTRHYDSLTLQLRRLHAELWELLAKRTSAGYGDQHPEDVEGYRVSG